MTSTEEVPVENEYGQPIGEPMTHWRPVGPVAPVSLDGAGCRLEPLGPEHRDGLRATLLEGSPPQTWTYLPDGPFEDDAARFDAYLEGYAARPDSVGLVVVDGDRGPVGLASYLRDDPRNGSVEVGHVVFSAALQRTRTATEAMYLMARHVFDDLGYRRYEWKCDSLNAPSRAAAQRLGFSFEGLFRQALVYKGRNRDTAWFAITDADWARLRPEYERWLAPENFDEDGRQHTPLRIQVPATGIASEA